MRGPYIQKSSIGQIHIDTDQSSLQEDFEFLKFNCCYKRIFTFPGILISLIQRKVMCKQSEGLKKFKPIYRNIIRRFHKRRKLSLLGKLVCF